MSDTKHRTGHVGLNVSDLGRSLEFYKRALELEVAYESTEEGRRFASLGDGERLVLTLWQQSDGRFATSTPGLHHLSFEVPTVEDVERARTRVGELGVRFLYDGFVAHAEGARSGGIFFEDPDGIRLEIYCPRGAEGRQPGTPGAPSCGFF